MLVGSTVCPIDEYWKNTAYQVQAQEPDCSISDTLSLESMLSSVWPKAPSEPCIEAVHDIPRCDIACGRTVSGNGCSCVSAQHLSRNPRVVMFFRARLKIFVRVCR